MHRKILLWGIGFAIIAVLLGAFGAHALKAILSPEKLQSYETGVRYQLIHALALIALSIYGQLNKTNDILNKWVGWSSHFFIVGAFLFSCSIYGLALLSVMHPSWAFILGPVTPMGGLCFMIGWAIWARAVWLNKMDM